MSEVKWTLCVEPVWAPQWVWSPAYCLFAAPVRPRTWLSSGFLHSACESIMKWQIFNSPDRLVSSFLAFWLHLDWREVLLHGKKSLSKWIKMTVQQQKVAAQCSWSIWGWEFVWLPLQTVKQADGSSRSVKCSTGSFLILYSNKFNKQNNSNTSGKFHCLSSLCKETTELTTRSKLPINCH